MGAPMGCARYGSAQFACNAADRGAWTMPQRDHGFPLQHLRLMRRGLAEAMKDSPEPPTHTEVATLAAVHQAIAALEAVIAETGRDAG